MKKICTYWHQGWEQAPELAQHCRHSWERLNPDYELHALDQHTLFDHINLPSGLNVERRDITVQKVAALARLGLLSKYGGVWTDATVMCTRSLSEWIKEYYDSRFFAFRNPGPDRLMSNWFIASESDSIIVQRLHRDFSDFYVHNRFSNQNTVIGQLLVKYFGRRWNSNPHTTQKWHSWFARKVLRVYPYFIFHYTFNKLILTDPACAALWHKAKPFSADAPHRVQELQGAPDGIEKAIGEIDSGVSPMHKLDWRVNISNTYWRAVLPCLREKSNDRHYSIQQTNQLLLSCSTDR